MESPIIGEGSYVTGETGQRSVRFSVARRGWGGVTRADPKWIDRLSCGCPGDPGVEGC